MLVVYHRWCYDISSFASPHSSDQPSHIIKTARSTMQHGVSRHQIPRNRKLCDQRRLRTRKVGDVARDRDISLIDDQENTQRSRLDVYLIFAVG